MITSTEDCLIFKRLTGDSLCAEESPSAWEAPLTPTHSWLGKIPHSSRTESKQMMCSLYRLQNKDYTLHKRNVPTKTGCPQQKADPMPCPLTSLCLTHWVPELCLQAIVWQADFLLGVYRWEQIFHTQQQEQNREDAFSLAASAQKKHFWKHHSSALPSFLNEELERVGRGSLFQNDLPRQGER